MAGPRLQVPGGIEDRGTRPEPYGLRRVRPARRGHGRPGPHLRHVLDEADQAPERGSPQRPEGRGDGAGHRQGQAPHLVGHQAVDGEPVGAPRAGVLDGDAGRGRGEPDTQVRHRRRPPRRRRGIRSDVSSCASGDQQDRGAVRACRPASAGGHRGFTRESSYCSLGQGPHGEAAGGGARRVHRGARDPSGAPGARA